MITNRILIESAAGSTEQELGSVLAADGRLTLDGDITTETAMCFLPLLQYMAKEQKEVTIYLNSGGGEIEAGLAIYDAIQAYPYTLNICCVELAASMAALLLASGKKGHRFILPHSKVLIHEPLLSKGFGGSATNIEKTAQRILDIKAQMNGLLAKHTGRSMNEINEATAYDHLMTAEEAISFGICDAIGTVY